MRELYVQVPSELYASFIAAIDKGNIRSMPNKSMPAAPYPTPGALLMGDAFNMRHPLTEGGMTVALSDIVVLRNLLKLYIIYMMLLLFASTSSHSTL
jgi:squalene monooxygenase